ncbi:MAG TPA: ATP-binding protein [Longimicrobiales bacterium]|nr:ATP-binding protein [Longimicrobiales bacterium]
MQFLPMPPDILDRLVEHRSLSRVPRPELEWLVAHGRFRRVDPGDHFLRRGETPEETGLGLEVILVGEFVVYVNRGAGPRKVMEWHAGDVTGMLPFSRMGAAPGDAVVDTTLETLSVEPGHFPALVRECPTVTEICVHVMLDRARVFNTSEWQDEKMASLGKLAAGLSHELNNPAAAVARSARVLKSTMAEADLATRRLALAGLTTVELDALEGLRFTCMAGNDEGSRSPLERADREDEIAEWLERHGADASAVEALADTAVTIEVLDRIAEVIRGDALDAALDWVAAGCAVRALADEIERAGGRVSELVGAMKRLTHMDRAPTPEPVDIEQGVRDTLTVLGHKARSKSVSVRIDVAPGLPEVRAIGGELNQVWMNLLDNALDAVDLGGHVNVIVKPEGRSLVVRVIDDGAGIPREHCPRIFDPFFTTKPVGQGTGLGLEIARTRVRGHGGDIDFDSRPGRTEFRVSLPLAVPEASVAISLQP